MNLELTLITIFISIYGCLSNPVPPPPKSMYDAILQTCPNLTNVTDFKNQSIFTQCVDWTLISQMADSELNEETSKAAVCLFYFDTFTQYCKSQQILDLPKVKPNLTTFEFKCDAQPQVALEHKISNNLENEVICIKLCLDLHEKPHEICKLSQYFLKASFKRLDLDLKHPNKFPETTVMKEIFSQLVKTDAKPLETLTVDTKNRNPPLEFPEISPKFSIAKNEPETEQSGHTGVLQEVSHLSTSVAVTQVQPSSVQENPKKDLKVPKAPTPVIEKQTEESAQPVPEPVPVKLSTLDEVETKVEHTENNVPAEVKPEISKKNDEKVEEPKIQLEEPKVGQDPGDFRDGDMDNEDDDVDVEEGLDAEGKFPHEADEEKPIIKKKKPSSTVEGEPINNMMVSEADDDGNSNFFSYFMVICIMFVVGYVGYHNRQKILALLLEGKRGRRPSRTRRPNSANYHKLDSNLEEAISSSCNKNTSNVIY